MPKKFCVGVYTTFKPFIVAVPCAGALPIAMLVIGPVSLPVTAMVAGWFDGVLALSAIATGLACCTLSVYACAPVKPRPSVAVIVTLKLPADVGEPVNAPVLAKLRPPGNAPAETV